MMKRIGLWAFAGLGAFLATAASFFGHSFDLYHWTVFRVTFPFSWFGRVPMTYYEMIFLNAAIYAVIGLATEPMRRRHH